jgi:hypothetical protein
MLNPMRQFYALVATIFVLTGCDSDGPDLSDSVVARGIVEVVHASADAPPVKILVDGSEAFTNLDFKQAVITGVEVGDVEIRVRGLLPDDGEVEVIPAAGDPAPVLSVAEGARVTVVALGDVAEIAPKVLVDQAPSVPAGEVRLRVLHAAPDVLGPGNSAVQVWLTNPEADIVDPAGTDTVITAVFEFQDLLTADPLQVPAGDYRVRVTLPGDPAAVAYDSGLISLPGAANFVIAAVPNTTAGLADPNPSPISLIATNGVAGAALEFLDQRTTQSSVRVVHLSADTDPVDVVVAGTIAIAGAAFAGPPTSGAPATAGLPPGPIEFGVAVSPYMPGDAFALEIAADLVAGDAVSILAVGSSAVDPNNPLEELVLPDVTRSIATEAQVRIVHASVLAQDVDIYVLPGNTLVPASDIPDDIDPAFVGIPYKADTGYLSLGPGDYDIAITATGQKTPAIGPITVNFAAGGIYSAIAVDGVGLTVPLSAILLNDAL